MVDVRLQHLLVLFFVVKTFLQFAWPQKDMFRVEWAEVLDLRIASLRAQDCNQF